VPGSRSGNVSLWHGPDRRAHITRDAIRFHWPPDRPPDDDPYPWTELRTAAEVTATCTALRIPLHGTEGTDRTAENAARELQLAGYWARRAAVEQAIRKGRTP
jgi:hypothetical protein